MSEIRINPGLIIGEKQGVPVYSLNPSVPAKGVITRTRKVQIGTEKKGLVIDGVGEILGHGSAVFYEFEEVDKERFVKLYLSGFKKAQLLTKSGMAIFSVVYWQMRDKPNSDKVELSLYLAKQQIKGLNERTYQRGVRELLKHEFLFRSPTEGVFFVNIQYMFNGDRIGFAHAYHLKGAQVQHELPLALPEPQQGEVAKAGG
jgi:hypothetical protein